MQRVLLIYINANYGKLSQDPLYTEDILPFHSYVLHIDIAKPDKNVL